MGGAPTRCYNPRRFIFPLAATLNSVMTFEQWQKANQLLQTALDYSPEQRAAFLQAACGSDIELRLVVERLLQVHQPDEPANETRAEADITSSLILPISQEEAAKPASDKQQLGAYQLLAELGRGSMGHVYLAEDTRLGRRVAIKLLPASMSGEASRLRRFEQEARAVSALNHPNIVTIFEVGIATAGRYIVMELVEGRTLRTVLSGSYTLVDVLSWGAQLAKALSAAHAAGIVHRDIKPENIMLRDDGYVKVLDFGLARLADNNTANLDQFGTTPGALIGTIRYMAPEQVRGEKAVLASDVFALGVVLYELLTRQHPFPGSTIYEIMHAITTRQPLPPARFAPDVPPEAATLVLAMLDKQAQRRPAAKEIAATLSACLSSASGSGSRRAAVVQPFPAFELTDQAEFQTSDEMAEPVSYTTKFDAPSPYETVVEAPVATPSHSSGSGVKTLAVLPFTQSGDNEEVEYLCDGVAESLINNLAALPNLRVLARSTVFRYKSPTLDPLAIGRELGVQSVLTGRVVQHSGKVVVKVELVNVNEGTQVWGENYLRPLTDVFALEAEIAQAISAQLRLKLSGAQQERLAKLNTENADAYQAYLRGRYYWNRRTEEGLKSAIEAFNQAITLDPAYALAYSGLADTYMVSGANGLWHPADTLPKAKAYATAALELDAALAAAHAALGGLHACYEFNWAASERSFQRALELNPGYSTTHFWYAVFYLLSQGRFDKTLAALDCALDPLSLIINTTRGYVLLLERRYDQALEQLQKARELEPAFYGSLEYVALLYEQTGQYEAALTAQQQLLTTFANDPAAAQALRAAYTSGGAPGYWRKRLEIMQAQAQRRYVYAHRFAELYARLGEREQALHWLEKACDERSARIIWIGVNPIFDELRNEPRFTALLRRMGLN
jgi:eukaryotic-like serine/threonine-protein kinase